MSWKAGCSTRTCSSTSWPVRRDTPVLDSVLLNVYHGQTNTDARNLGEPAKVATVAAVVNAIYNATGAWVTELPLTPEPDPGSAKRRATKRAHT